MVNATCDKENHFYLSSSRSLVTVLLYIAILLFLPACFFNSRNNTSAGQLAETNPAESEVANIAPLTSAPETAPHLAG